MVEICQLNCTRGWNTVRWLDCSGKGLTSDGMAVVTMVMSGLFWDRQRMHEEGLEDAELVDEFQVRLDQILVDIDEMQRLNALLSQLDGEGSVTLGADADSPTVTFNVTRHDPEVISDGKPIVTLDYEAAGARGSVRFVTDQSCLRIAAEHLTRWLADKG